MARRVPEPKGAQDVKAVDCLAEGGDIRKGTETAFEIEQLAYEAIVTVDAIRLLKSPPPQS
jgi:hypothetical protein